MFNFWKSYTEKGAPRCVLLGLDTSGKTTLLYMWHSGRPVRTIPTIGFNLETIRHSGRTMQVLDFGGCDKLAPMARHYLDSTTGILFLHALNVDADRVEESIELLQMHTRQLLDANGKYVWIIITKQDLVKPEGMDLRRTQMCTKIEKAMREFEGKIEWKVFDERGLSVLDWVRMWPVFDDIAEKLTTQGLPQPIFTERKYDEEQMRLKIMREEIDDEPADQFWRQFLNADLPRWNHRNHLRAGFIMLLKSASMLEDFWTAVDTFLEHINRLHKKRPDRFRNTAHRTMTTFWLYALQLAILKFRDQDVVTHLLPREDQFQGILISNPQMADPSYWEDYYSRSIMFTPEARGNWCLPDKKPLLTNFQPAANVKAGKVVPIQHHTSVVDVRPSAEREDENQMRLMAFAVSVVQHYFNTGQRRGEAVTVALARLQRSTLQLRASSPSSNVQPYSETQAYFWIQIVHATLLPFHQHRLDRPASNWNTGFDLTTPTVKPVQTFTYSQFIHIFRVSPSLWKQYYSPRLWTSVNARMSFVNPDLHALPNVFRGSGATTIAQRFLEAKGSLVVTHDDQEIDTIEEKYDLYHPKHSSEETSMQIDFVVARIEAVIDQTATNDVGMKDDGGDKNARKSSLQTLPAHDRLLLLLFVLLQRSTNPVTGQVDISIFISRILSQDSAYTIDGDNNTRTSRRSSEAHLADGLKIMGIDEHVVGLTNMGVTQLMFYAHMVLSSSHGFRAAKNEVEEEVALSSLMRREADTYSTDGFRAFLVARPYLLWEKLPYQFYRPETWHSLDAKVMMMSPDIKSLPAY